MALSDVIGSHEMRLRIEPLRAVNAWRIATSSGSFIEARLWQSSAAKQNTEAK